MDKKLVKDLMVPLEEYATVSEDATLKDALLALEQAQLNFDKDKYRHRAIVVLNKENKVVGKISQLDVLKALEPKYDDLQSPNAGLSRYGFGKKFLEDMYKQYQLWSRPITEMIRKAAKLKIKSFMYELEEGEYTNLDTPIEEAIHMLVIGHHHSLLVRDKDKIVGILRLVDVFYEVNNIMKTIE